MKDRPADKEVRHQGKGVGHAREKIEVEGDRDSSDDPAGE